MKRNSRDAWRLFKPRGRLKAVSAAGLALLLLTGCAPEHQAADQAPFEPVLELHDLMALVLDPATDVIWGAAGSVITIRQLPK